MSENTHDIDGQLSETQVSYRTAVHHFPTAYAICSKCFGLTIILCFNLADTSKVVYDFYHVCYYTAVIIKDISVT